MLDLALHYDSGLIPLKDISARQVLSEKYLEQIMMLLNRTSLVRSVRGSQGGYTLARPPKDITVGDVLRTMEGSLSPVDCVNEQTMCPMSEQCVTIDVWREIKTAVDAVVDNITLADLVEKHHQKCPSDYCI